MNFCRRVEEGGTGFDASKTRELGYNTWPTGRERQKFMRAQTSDEFNEKLGPKIDTSDTDLKV